MRNNHNLKYYNYDIVFQEVPDEVALAINITNCPHRCPGCHSPHLQEDIGPVLNEESLSELVDKYAGEISCVCFMGGDANPLAVEALAKFTKQVKKIKTAWYSGSESIPEDMNYKVFDYIKIGPYIEKYGGLKSKTTNQIYYQILPSGEKKKINNRFWK
ncbi:MAG: anaerobic ribonucleoside-triphosphate reductase activating protein [Bacteroidales bacterium]